MEQWHSDEVAERWDATAGEALPTRAEQEEILLSVLATGEISDGVMLELGVGSGLVAERVLETCEHAHLVGIDVSIAMLELARKRLERFGSRVQLLQHDLAQLRSMKLPSARYVAAFSVQTLHHLSDPDKASVIAWAAERVVPGGPVVIVDRTKVPEPLFHDWAAVWRRLGAGTPTSFREHLEELECGDDRPALLEDQLRWLADAGLAAACLHAYGNRVVLVGRQAPQN